MRNHVWIIEIRDRGQWIPCASAHLSKTSAKHDMEYYWMENYPDNLFKITKYVRDSKEKK